ncbi:MAG: thiol-disulfide isomerase-like thioredoxin [Phycisphaerales bacterium]|nr:thiol-disulfide isomerase-like thioredoxin [Phycisphaerales bacterium]
MNTKLRCSWVLACVAAVVVFGNLNSARAADRADAEHASAPGFKGATGWLNTEKPISLDDLKGQVVVLDFWTYCCINCIHIMPDLKFLEEKYKDQPLVVIGVHSGKFDEEKDADHIRQAVLRHNLTHPIAIDNDMNVWNAFDVHSWPTLVLIAPDGSVVGSFSGEGHRDQLDRKIASLLDIYRQKGQLGKHLNFKPERVSFKSGELEFPGKVLADAAGQRLFVSDTNHHRIVVASLDGKISLSIGSGKPGLLDGDFAQAQFHQPQGLALSADGKTLYVADTENHAIRAVDLEKKAVTTIAGTGAQFKAFMPPEGPAKAAALSSPWDLALVGRGLYIAMAGTHQIWVIDLDAGTIGVFAGTRREAAIDAPNRAASFAQPSGLDTDGKVLYVADSEASSIRTVELGDKGATVTLAGSGDLFGFGATDAAGSAARFQHPLGVALAGDTLFVADTFNNLIRTIDPKTGSTKTWLGTGKNDPGTPQLIGLYEPGGLSAIGDTLYIADTNHHRVLAVDIKTKKATILIGG